MIRLVACGKVKEKWMKAGIEEYAGRIKAYDKLEIIETKDEIIPESNSAAQNAIAVKTEGERILKQIRDDEYVILLDLHGKEMDSVSFAGMLKDLYDHSHNRICFVIGGSLGVSEELVKRADFRWKLGECTYPHQLCRILVLEQIYRGFKINRHEPYHK